jgi:dUTP pyrophosphatase
MKVKIKKLNEHAVLPTKGTKQSAGFDLVATSMNVYPDYVEYGTSLSFEIPEGHVGKIYPRSSISSSTQMVLCNSTGIIDADYRGEVKLRFRQLVPNAKKYNVGDKMGQIIIEKLLEIEFEEAKEVTETVRGTGSFGSTGR